MRSGERQLLGILRIGHAVSVRGEGLSVRDALGRCDDEGLRVGRTLIWEPASPTITGA